MSANEVLNNNIPSHIREEGFSFGDVKSEHIISAMKEFAKYHVERALEESARIANRWENSGELGPVIENEAYSLDNIK